VDIKKLARGIYDSPPKETSKDVRKRIIIARNIQQYRFKKESIHTNSEMKNRQIKEYISLESSSKSMLMEAADTFQLSARSYLKVIKLARTIADLDDSPEIRERHTAEALQFRPRISQ